MNEHQNHRVLVVDDNRAIHEDFRKILCGDIAANAGDLSQMEDAIFGDVSPVAAAAQSFEVHSSYQGQEGFARVEQARHEGRPYAVAFVDMRMPPGWDGLRTVREIWRCDPNINIVICTAFSDHSWSEIEAVDEAGDRLLVLKKPFEPIEVRRLAATLTAKWTMARQATLKMTELKDIVDARTRELHMAATHDRLTALPNRALFHERVTDAMTEASRQKHGDPAVLFLDFDRFKSINDSLGHAGGDELLKAIAGRLTAALRGTDMLAWNGGLTARLGGDEFCVLLTGMHDIKHDASAVAERLLDTLAAPYEIAGSRVQSTASIGVALHASHYSTADEMIRDADTAMYRAKASGRGRIVLFDATMHEQSLHRLGVETELRQAIARGELEAFYQPQVDVTTGVPTGAEALARWRHPLLGLLSPAEFILVAEETGMIHELGLSILEQAAAQSAAWKSAYPDIDLSISVNVSTKQLARPAFVAEVKEILARTHADPTNLIFEITETTLVYNAAMAVSVVRDFQAMGIRVYLDDFGTGYSSLSLLHTFKLDGLKIDRSFIHEAANRREVVAIIRAVTELARALDMDIVAEGIETGSQLLLLQELNCPKAQGYFYSQPVVAAEFERQMLADKPKVQEPLSAAA